MGIRSSTLLIRSAAVFVATAAAIVGCKATHRETSAEKGVAYDAGKFQYYVRVPGVTYRAFHGYWGDAPFDVYACQPNTSFEECKGANPKRAIVSAELFKARMLFTLKNSPTNSGGGADPEPTVMDIIQKFSDTVGKDDDAILNGETFLKEFAPYGPNILKSLGMSGYNDKLLSILSFPIEVEGYNCGGDADLTGQGELAFASSWCEKDHYDSQKCYLTWKKADGPFVKIDVRTETSGDGQGSRRDHWLDERRRIDFDPNSMPDVMQNVMRSVCGKQYATAQLSYVWERIDAPRLAARCTNLTIRDQKGDLEYLADCHRDGQGSCKVRSVIRIPDPTSTAYHKNDSVGAKLSIRLLGRPLSDYTDQPLSFSGFSGSKAEFPANAVSIIAKACPELRN